MGPLPNHGTLRLPNDDDDVLRPTHSAHLHTHEYMLVRTNKYAVTHSLAYISPHEIIKNTYWQYGVNIIIERRGSKHPVYSLINSGRRPIIVGCCECAHHRQIYVAMVQRP